MKKLLLISIPIVLMLTLLSVGIGYYYFFSENSPRDQNNISPSPQVTQSISESCNYSGVDYQDGQTFDKGDSCNTCSCDNGKVMCGENKCYNKFPVNLRPIVFGEEDFEPDIAFYINSDLFNLTNAVYQNENSILEINEAEYELEIYIANETVPVTFETKIPIVEVLNKFLDISLYRFEYDDITSSKNENGYPKNYLYTTHSDFYSCEQFQGGNVQACFHSSAYFNNLNLHIACKASTDEGAKRCDEIVASISIDPVE